VVFDPRMWAVACIRGPKHVHKHTFAYTARISEEWKRQVFYNND